MGIIDAGEDIGIPVDGIHAYLYVDIVECIARSDNALSTGFRLRADRDSVETLVQALASKHHDTEKPPLPRSNCEFSRLGGTSFKPAMSEFNMLVTGLKLVRKTSSDPLLGLVRHS